MTELMSTVSQINTVPTLSHLHHLNAVDRPIQANANGP